MINQQSKRGADRPAGIEGSTLPGPYSVGHYAMRLRERVGQLARVQVYGDLVNLHKSDKAVYFELRDADPSRGGLECAMWRTDFDRLRVKVADGAQIVVAGGCEFYPGSATSSPSFSFRATDLRLAGDGDLLAEIERRRRELHEAGLLERQKWLLRPAVPPSIGVVTSEKGKARDDVLAGLKRRGWTGRLVWAFVPVQDRHAAPAIATALQDLAVVANVDVIIVARGGGSVMDLMAFSDETLCRTVAMLPVPVIASVGHHTDRTLIDEVAAVSCSTPTHAAEAAVPASPREAQRALKRVTIDLIRLGRSTVPQRRQLLGYLRSAVDSHDPEQVLARGFALVEDEHGKPVTDAARAAGTIRIRFHDGVVEATVTNTERS
ncbi:MAG: exodeoxyribonuclease large subunit [Thermoleophilaceae bacterium]|jgi:exodeoxyribonuclease VII large subunit|nr:exodeoxyribonuclease large subunit [Thermoleophilaceae bacterium]